MARTRFHLAQMDCAVEEQLVRMRLDDVPTVEAVAVDLDLDLDLDQRTVAVDHHGDPGDISAALDTLGLRSRLLDPDDSQVTDTVSEESGQRRALAIALAINAGFFAGELGAGLWSRSMGLVADSLDMLADASVYALSLAAVGHVAARKKRLAAASGYLQLTLAGIGLVAVIRRCRHQ